MYVSIWKKCSNRIFAEKQKNKKIWIQDSFNDQTILSLIQKRQIGYKKCPKIELDRLANGVHQGYNFGSRGLPICKSF